jgi:hypothetical protein
VTTIVIRLVLALVGFAFIGAAVLFFVSLALAAVSAAIGIDRDEEALY